MKNSAHDTNSGTLAVQPDTIPEALRATPRWVGWRLEVRDGKPTKVPYIATDATPRASTTDPATWTDFTTALATYQEGALDGIGFVLGDGFFGLDIDDCRDPASGAITEEAKQLIELIDTYAEVSPRAHGLKAIGRGRKPGTKCRTGKVELYDHDRFFCITGHHLDGTPTSVEERTDQLKACYLTLFPEVINVEGNDHRPSDRPAADQGDAALIDMATNAKNGAAFAALWGGDVSGYPSHSEADQALANHLAFWCNGKSPIALIDSFGSRACTARSGTPAVESAPTVSGPSRPQSRGARRDIDPQGRPRTQGFNPGQIPTRPRDRLWPSRSPTSTATCQCTTTSLYRAASSGRDRPSTPGSTRSPS